MKNWIWPVTPINWPVVKEKKVWAVDTRGKGERVVKGDHIIFYVNKSRCFQGIFEVASDWHEPTVTWPDSKQAFPVSEIDLKPIQLGYANFRKLIDKLEFIESKKSVGLYLRGTPHGPANSAKPISNHDYQLLLSELEQVQEKPYEDKSKESLDVEEFIPVTSWSFISERIHELPTPNLKSIDSIINDIKNGKYAIPIFQREYTWKRKQIEELWESIFQGFFVGSILTWDSDEQLATISVHGAPNLSNTYDIVLDGQQRITSLFYAVTTPDIALPDNHSMRFFVDLKALLDPNASSSDIIFSERTGRAEKLGYLDMNKQFEKKIFPLDAFNSRNYAFWITSFKTYLEKVEGLDGTESENYYREILSILDHVWFQYKIPVVQLPKSLSLDSVAEVFEKINSKGTRLGVFDLLNARFTSYDVSLRTIWDQAKSNYDNIKKLNREIDDAEKYILQGMALFKKGHIRRKELLNLNNCYIELKIFHKEAFLADWLKLCKHTESNRPATRIRIGAVKFSIPTQLLFQFYLH